MKTDKFLDDYLVANNDYDTVLKKKIKKVFIISLIVFSVLVFFKPVTYMRERLEYNTTKLRKERASRKSKYNDYFTNFDVGNKKYIESIPNSTLTYNNKYVTPIKGRVTSNYGYRTSPYRGFHTGIDIQGKHHDKVVTIEKGLVIFTGVQRGYGNCILIHNFGEGEEFYTFYAHLSKILVKEGQSLEKGQIIALEGGAATDPNPGYSTGHHLHFEVRRTESLNSHVDPRPYIF